MFNIVAILFIYNIICVNTDFGGNFGNCKLEEVLRCEGLRTTVSKTIFLNTNKIQIYVFLIVYVFSFNPCHFVWQKHLCLGAKQNNVFLKINMSDIYKHIKLLLLIQIASPTNL